MMKRGKSTWKEQARKVHLRIGKTSTGPRKTSTLTKVQMSTSRKPRIGKKS